MPKKCNMSSLSEDSPSKADNMDKSFNIKSNIIYSKASGSGKEKYIGLKIKDLNDLKNSIPCVKLPIVLPSSVAKKNSEVPEEIKQKLQKYCRTCAGIKVPMIDIFSEKGNQMRLLQQIQHLEDIDKDTSLSTQMCMECICDLKASYKLFMQIKKAEMKLKSIFDLLSKTSSQQGQTNLEIKADSGSSTKISKVVVSESNDSQSCDIEIKCETDVDEYYDEPIYEEEEYEDFEPVDSIQINDEVSENETPEASSPDKPAYKYVEAVNAYVKVDANEETQSDSVPKTKKSDVTPKKEASSNQSKKPNILKRKAPSESPNDDNKNKKLDINKLNLDLKVKIPRLDFNKPIKMDSDDDGVMYVTAKGSKPNERLLIKVKKVDKSEKKTDKASAKKKDTNSALRSFLRFESEDKIDEQIEEYKKKRVQVLGQIANIQDDDAELPDIRIVKKSISAIEEKNSVEIKEEDKDSKDLQSISRSEIVKQKMIDVTRRPSDANKDLTEDCVDRIKAILKQKDEYINDFVTYLKQRRIVASRLRDKDIIDLYEKKNNVVIDINQPVFDDPDADPFEERENYDCNFCFRTFPTRELVFEHEKIHDNRLMHYCEDCGREFLIHKAKRMHSGTCIKKITCRYCDEVLESKGKKRQHEQKHIDEMYGQLCDRCGEKFKHQGTLDQHYKSKHMQLEKIFKCPQCPKRFAFRTKLTFHLKSVHTTCRAYLCEDCGSDFKNPASLRHHRIRKHQNHKKECQVCKKMIPVYSMSKHMHTHKSYSINCQHCDKKFKNTSTLRQHMRIHEDQRQYKCDHCGVGFNRRDGLRLHLKVHERNDGKGLKECSCQVCGQKFPNHSTLVIHRNREHKDGRKHTCHICNRSMISTRSLEWHLAHIHNEPLPSALKENSSIDAETKRVTCLHCEKTFKTEMILRTHVKNTHIEKEPIKCPDCEEQYTSEVRLKHHMMVQHGRTEGTFACPHCSKRFVNQLRLKTHMISHSEERPHTCDVCGFMLKTRIQLVKHKQNRHSNERPLQCKYCPHTCKQVSALVCHERTHTNERPYACSVCQQRFKYLGDKNKHERRHEVLGGSGFKRIVVNNKDGASSEKRKKKKKKVQLQLSTEQQQHGVEGDLEVTAAEEYATETEAEDMENFGQAEIMKLEGDTLVSQSGVAFETLYIKSVPANAAGSQIVSVENAADYSEEVVADQVESQIITHEMIDENVLRPGTVIELEQRDETGKIVIMPYLLSDLSEANAEVNLTASSILYQN